MRLPILYALRCVRERWVTTLLTCAGLVVTTFVFVVLMALAHGIQETFVLTGDPLNVVVLRKGATSETRSVIFPDRMNRIRGTEGLAADKNGSLLISEELVVIVSVPMRSGENTNLLVRAMSPRGRAVRPGVELVEGRWPRHGQDEAAIGQRLLGAWRGGHLGDTVPVSNKLWRVVGVFRAGGSAYESEVWADIDDVMGTYRRKYSSAVLRGKNVSAAAALLKIGQDRWLNVDACGEQEYFARQTKSGRVLEQTAWFAAILLGIGAACTAMNSMFAAVTSRGREICMLKVLGFTGTEIQIAFLLEALAMGLAGGMAGCLLGFLFNNATAATLNWETFSEIQFTLKVTWKALLAGLCISLGAGALGGLLPAIMASRMPLVSGLRQL